MARQPGNWEPNVNRGRSNVSLPFFSGYTALYSRSIASVTSKPFHIGRFYHLSQIAVCSHDYCRGDKPSCSRRCLNSGPNITNCRRLRESNSGRTGNERKDRICRSPERIANVSKLRENPARSRKECHCNDCRPPYCRLYPPARYSKHGRQRLRAGRWKRKFGDFDRRWGRDLCR
jgi:hypothetical protein